MSILINSWVETALDSNSTKFSELISGLPQSASQLNAASLAKSSGLEERVYALRSVSQDHSVGGVPELAALLATVGIRFCERAYELYGPGTANSFVFGVSHFEMDAHRAYGRMDRRIEQVSVVGDALKWLTAREADECDLVDLRFARGVAVL